MMSCILPRRLTWTQKKKKNYIYISHFYKTKYDRQDVLQDNKNVIIYHLRLRIELGRER